MSRAGQSVVDFLAPRLGYWYIRLLKATMRLEYRNREVLDRARAEGGSYILAFWHSRFVMMTYSYPDGNMSVLSSTSRDSQLLARILRRFGHKSAWGSSTRGGAAALREIVRRIRKGSDAGFTPDGPRGPRRRVQPGVIAAARLSGKPIIPVAFSARPARRLRSWDRTLLPYPFARGLFIYGEPIRVARAAGGGEEESCRLALEAELDRLTDLTDTELGLAPEDPRPEAGG
jgi:lysophospholipid acyltransferase (LPLAT)-like uncharacterized protein